MFPHMCCCVVAESVECEASHTNACGLFLFDKATTEIVHDYLTFAVVHIRLKAVVIRVMWPPPLCPKGGGVSDLQEQKWYKKYNWS